MGGKVQGRRRLNARYKIDTQKETKNSIGNGEVKELICTTHGHDLRGRGNAGESGVQDRGGERGVKNGTTVIA